MLPHAKTDSSDAANILDQALRLVEFSFSASNKIPHRVEGAKHATTEVSQWSNADLFFLIDSVRHGSWISRNRRGQSPAKGKGA
jgi:hypothetical protein